MKYTKKTIYFILLVLIFAFSSSQTFSRDTKFKYSKDDISNYFSGVISLNQNYSTTGFKYLNKVKSLKNIHSDFNIKFIRLLVLLEKFDQAFAFAKDVWKEEEFVFEIDLLLGLEAFLKNDYIDAEKYFLRLNRISRHNIYFDDFFGNILMSWVKASENKKNESIAFLDKIPRRYNNLKKIQSAFLQCHFNTSKTEVAFENLIGGKDSSFSRYYFFLTNYFLHKDKKTAAELVIKNSRIDDNSNILLKQTEDFILAKNTKKIKNYFNCNKPTDVISELFYIVANLHATENDYHLSNFYLKLSLFLNDKFTPNKILLAENFYNQKKYKDSKKIYNSVKSIGKVYSWYASTRLALILSITENEKKSTSYLEKELNSLANPTFENYFDLANFFKSNANYEESVKYYSLILKQIDHDHFLVPKILDSRGTSYERMGDWENAERDLLESLKIKPDQPHVLNYLAYSWVDKGINIEKSLEMLNRANKLSRDDGYIIDSLGWAHYANKNYIEAKSYLQRAVELMPLDPVINDHYADVLWMLNKNLQARYVWKYVLSLKSTEEKLKENINKKLIFGIAKNL